MVLTDEMRHLRLPDGNWLLEAHLQLPHPVDVVFPFFSDAFNLQKLTPAFLDFRVVTPGPIEMRVGALIDYRLSLHGLPIRWRTEIIEWKPNHRFVDTQLKGPYSLWHHEHIFESNEQGTLCTDRVTYRVPGGRLIHRLFVGRDVERIFRFRQSQLKQIFP